MLLERHMLDSGAPMKTVIWIACIAAAILGLGTVFYRVAVMAHTHVVSFDTYISIVLTALAVILAALAIFIGLAAIWGYQQISSQAELRAEKAVGEHVAKLFAENNVQEMIRARAEEQGDRVWQDMIAETPKANEADNRTVGDPYP